MKMSGEYCCRCREPPVLYQQYSGRYLCAEHLAADILVRVKRTIRLQGGLGKKPILAVLEESPLTHVMLSLLAQVIASRPGMEILLLHSGKCQVDIVNIMVIFPSDTRIQRELVQPDSIMEIMKGFGADRLIRCSTLDDEGEKILSSLLSGSCCLFSDLKDYSPIVCLAPLCEIPLNELELYAAFRGLIISEPCGREKDGPREFLASLTENHPSIPFSLIKYAGRIRELNLG